MDWWDLLRYSIELGRVEMARAGPGQSHHMIDRSGRIGLVRGKRTVKTPSVTVSKQHSGYKIAIC